MTESQVDTAFADSNRALFKRLEKLAAEMEELTEELESDELTDKQIAEKTRRHGYLSRRYSSVNDQIVSENKGLIYAQVRRFTALADEHEEADLVGAASAGFAEAMRTYDPDQAPLAHWLYLPIKKEVLGAVHRNSPDHMNDPREDFDRKPDVKRAVAALTSAGLPATDEVVAEKAGVEVWRVKRIRASMAPRSLDAPAGTTDRNHTTLGELIEAEPEADPSEQVVDDAILGRAIVQMLPLILTNDELFSVMRYYGLDGKEPIKYKDLAEALGLSREAVRKRVVRAHCKVLHPLVLSKIMKTNP